MREVKQMPIKLLGEVCEVIAGQSPPSSTYNSDRRGLPFFQGKADFGVLYPTPRVWCDRPKKVAEPNDILISVRAPVGPTNICPTKACIGRGLSAVRPKVGADYKFVLYYLRYVEPQLSNQGRGSTFNAITQDEILSLKIPCPPLSIQKKIAAILEQADAAREKRRQASRLTGEFLRSAFLEMFGDPVENPKGWRTFRMGEIASRGKHSLIRGPFGGAIKKDIFVPDGYKVYEQKNAIAGDFEIGCYYIDEEKYREMRAFAVRPDDLIISCSGTIGRVAIVPGTAKPGIINQALMKITVDRSKATPVFMKSMIETSYLQGLMFGNAAGSAIKNVKPLKEIKEKVFPLPPLSEQKNYDRVAEKVETLRAKQRESEKELDDLFHSLMQRAFRGELVR